MSTERLIDSLIADARPVRRMRPPGQRILAWIAVAAVLVAAVVVVHGIRPDLMACLTEWQFLTGTIAPLVTGVLAAIGVLLAAHPDRSERWLLLPVPALTLWIGGTTTGCLMDWSASDFSRVRLGAVLDCLSIVGGVGLVLTIVQYLLLRPVLRAAPRGTLMVASLATASMATAVHALTHSIETSAMLLLWSPGVAALVFGVCLLATRHMRVAAVPPIRP